MNFNHDTFASNLGGYTGVTVDTSKGWDQWTGTSGDLNKVLNYSKNSYEYRTWYFETTNTRNNVGMLVACKIDWNNGIGDDHIVLLTGFSTSVDGPKLVFAKASVQFHGDEDQNVVSDPITSGDIGQGIYDSLNAQIEVINFSSDAAGRSCLPDIARANVNSQIGAVS